MYGQRSWVLIAVLGGIAGCTPATPSAATQPAATPSAATAHGSDGPAPGRTGAALFNGNCTACHQQSGQGIPGIYPSLAGSPIVLGDPKTLARWVVKGQRAASMPPGRFSTAMPQFGWLKNADAAALFTYLRSSFGNHAPPVDAATVASALGE